MRKFKYPSYIHIIADALIIYASFFLSLWLRTEDLSHLAVLKNLALLFTVIRLGTMVFFGVYNIIWRYISVEDAYKIVRAVFVSAAFIIAATYMIDIGTLPRSMFLIDAILVTMGLGGVRVLRRTIHKHFQNAEEKRAAPGQRRTIIVGAGDTGRILAQRISNEPQFGCFVVGFVDDDLKKVGRSLGGHKILGSVAQLEKLIELFEVEEVIVAIKHPAGELLRDLVFLTKKVGLPLRLVSGLDTSAGSRSGILRPIDPQDLIKRRHELTETESIERLIQGKRVMVTGAGGSIGGELCRQIARYHPTELVLLDHSEFSLFTIDQELRASGPSQFLVPTLGDIKDRVHLQHVMAQHRPQIIFHAAAYKHVPLVESNPQIAITNSILSTKNLVELATEFGCERFVLISSDKAVNPVGVMGATKRVCEMIVSSMADYTGRAYSSVRFGNVLGSSGSLVPQLEKQIQNGEPITLTHPEMKRFFMTGSEAVTLVLKSATITQPGDIALFKMGEPVKIVDIAKSLIALMGKTEEEVPVVFSGVRPGEKMFEELYLTGRELNTSHPEIVVVPKGDQTLNLSREFIEQNVKELLDLAHNSDAAALDKLFGLALPERLAATETQTPI